MSHTGKNSVVAMVSLVFTVGTKITADPENCFQQLISEEFADLLWDKPCLELIISSSSFQALLFLQDKLLESILKLLHPVKKS